MITVRKASSAADLEHVYAIRKRVFVEEQHCPPELEYAHEEQSTHFVALFQSAPCGAARWRRTDKGVKLERFAVLPEYRNKGVGGALVRAVLADLPDKDSLVYLNAQVSAESFYQAFGFVPVGERFEEAGIMHQQMKLVP